MSATCETITPKGRCTVLPDRVSVECKTKIGDCTYELFVGTCSCGQPIYRLMRTCGAAISIYQISQEDYENLEDYIAELHATFAEPSKTAALPLIEPMLVRLAKPHLIRNAQEWPTGPSPKSYACFDVDSEIWPLPPLESAQSSPET